MTSAEPERVVAGRYRLQAVIGRGGMGAIWRAHDELLDRDVALKEITWPPELDQADREVVRNRAVREAQLAARLRHPNVVGVYDIVEEDDRPCIVMELVPFRSLRDAVVEDGPMTPSQAARIGLEVLAALRAVHGTGVVHRDVKPSNILLSPEGRVVLTDFGIAKAADSSALTGTGVLMGSPSFVAPERARGGAAGTAADLWALGASLYTAVEGKPPFERGDPLASLTAVVSEEPDISARAGSLRPVIEGLLRKDSADRLDVIEAEAMLRRVVEGDAGADEDASAAGDDGVPGSPGADEDASADGDASAAGDDSADQDDSVAENAVAAGEVNAAGSASAAGGSAAAGESAAAGARAPAAAARNQRWRLAGLVALAVVAIAVITISLIVAAQGPGGNKVPASGASAASSAPGPATSGPAATTPAPSASAASSPAAALPAGYYRFTNSTGFSIGVPRGWQISHDGHYVYIRDPANSGIFLLIDQSDQPKASPLSDWEQQAASRQSSYPGYHLIRIQAVPYAQAIKAADWQFTYDRNGIQVEVLNRNILANSHHAYALYWSAPESEWNADYHYFETFAATFRPA